ncbi:vWA domain-containing protein [Schnuerera ultunensis]|uniref:vWA domain-containing protein n=1 Tax=Schnuerera ultunensis TaxID=45497 RepID=UPI000418FCA2|nr:VWA domain-containing protein [Schnuerera ultunensis]
MLNQIIVISDGQSNVGPEPSGIAELALNKNVKVNTIGIIDSGRNKDSILELENIAEKGGGLCELTSLDNLSETLSRVTINSVYSSIEEVVSNELKELMDLDLYEISPNDRNKIINMIDKIGNEVTLKCLILLDTSGSMKNKIAVARKSVLELLIFLKERKGENHIGFMTFPGKTGHYQLLCDFTTDIDELKEEIENIDIGGTTPTGHALEGAIKVFFKEEEEYSINQYII